MTDEEVIRGEAKVAAKRWLYFKDGGESYVGFSKHIKEELNRFYQPGAKAIFLDEVRNWLTEHLTTHQAGCSKHQAGENCAYENMVAKALFFVRQEQGELPLIIHGNDKSSDSRHTVFISYSHFDKKWLNIMKRHFKPLEGRIDFWDDSKIKPGQKWKEEIESAIGRAKVALLLLSADFFGSDFITKKEIPPLLESAKRDGAMVLFVVLKPFLVAEYPQILEYQGVNAPSKPFIRMSEADREDLCVNLVTLIRDALPKQVP